MASRLITTKRVQHFGPGAQAALGIRDRDLDDDQLSPFSENGSIRRDAATERRAQVRDVQVRGTGRSVARLERGDDSLEGGNVGHGGEDAAVHAAAHATAHRGFPLTTRNVIGVHHDAGKTWPRFVDRQAEEPVQLVLLKGPALLLARGRSVYHVAIAGRTAPAGALP